MWNINDLRVYHRRPDLSIGDEIPFLNFSAQMLARKVWTWSMTCLSIDRVTSRLQEGHGIYVTLGGHELLEGFIDVEGPYTWDSESGREVVNYNGADDRTIVADFIAWPYPETSTGGDWLRLDIQRMKQGPGETVFLDFVDENAGTGRHANRLVAGLNTPWLVDVPSTQGRGESKQITVKYTPLMEVMRECFDGTNLDMNVVVNDNRDGFDLVVNEYRDTNLTFAPELHNLINVSIQNAVPDFNVMLIAVDERSIEEEDPENSSETVNVRERRVRGRHHSMTNFFDWGPRHREVFEDPGDLREFDDSDPPVAVGDSSGPTSDFSLPELRKARQDTFVEAELTQGPRSIFLEDFQLGDQVTIRIPSGREYAARINAVEIEANADSGRLDVKPRTGIPGEDPSENMEEKYIRKTAESARRLRGR